MASSCASEEPSGERGRPALLGVGGSPATRGWAPGDSKTWGGSVAQFQSYPKIYSPSPVSPSAWAGQVLGRDRAQGNPQEGLPSWRQCGLQH